jgi:hypothetical protein
MWHQQGHEALASAGKGPRLTMIGSTQMIMVHVSRHTVVDDALDAALQRSELRTERLPLPACDIPLQQMRSLQLLRISHDSIG